jgi:hypothetical protein
MLMVDRICRGHLRPDDPIPITLPVLVVDENEHAPIARFLYDFLSGGDMTAETVSHCTALTLSLGLPPGPKTDVLQ